MAHLEKKASGQNVLGVAPDLPAHLQSVLRAILFADKSPYSYFNPLPLIYSFSCIYTLIENYIKLKAFKCLYAFIACLRY